VESHSCLLPYANKPIVYVSSLSSCLPLLILTVGLSAQQTDLIGYWQNWNSSSAPYIPLTEIDDRYTIIQVAFALPAPGTTYEMTFTPDGIDQGTFIDQVQTLQDEGKKVLLSLGGATSIVTLQDEVQKGLFVNSMLDLLLTYSFDGFDIDLEGSSVSITGGSIEAPVDPSINFLIEGIAEVMEGYWEMMGKRCVLTMAPETAFVQGGQTSFNGVWGAYLPVIDALRDSIEILHVQLYNSGSMYGIDGGIYFQSSADFIVSQTEALLQGFQTDGGFFAPLAPQQVAVGLPACQDAAGGGYTEPYLVEAGIHYLLSGLQQPGIYTAFESYPDLRGMMTWSINWDALNTCNGDYSYADTYELIFGDAVGLDMPQQEIPLFTLAPNPLPEGSTIQIKATDQLHTIRIVDALGRVRLHHDLATRGALVSELQLPLSAGMYIVVGHNHSGRSYSEILVIQK
jgi:chitinase